MMSKFLDSITARLSTVLHGWANADDEDLSDDIISIKRDIQQLGENARRMLEIGIVQDELVKLGLIAYVLSHNHPYFMIKRGKERIEVNFGSLWVGIIIHRETGEHSRIFECLYSNENCQINWQEDLINKVKELIND